MFRSDKLCAALIIASAGAAPALAAQPQFLTPAGVAPLPNAAYVIPYASYQSGGGQNRNINTVVTVGNNETAIVCVVQVQWLDWDGTVLGYSGPFAIPPGHTYEFTTLSTAAIANPPFIENVFRNDNRSFEGHAKVRTTCLSTARLRVNAQSVAQYANGDVEYKHIKVTRVTGNAGD